MAPAGVSVYDEARSRTGVASAESTRANICEGCSVVAAAIWLARVGNVASRMGAVVFRTCRRTSTLLFWTPVQLISALVMASIYQRHPCLSHLKSEDVFLDRLVQAVHECVENITTLEQSVQLVALQFDSFAKSSRVFLWLLHSRDGL